MVSLVGADGLPTNSIQPVGVPVNELRYYYSTENLPLTSSYVKEVNNKDAAVLI